jgi:hypothetical protein
MEGAEHQLHAAGFRRRLMLVRLNSPFRCSKPCRDGIAGRFAARYTEIMMAQGGFRGVNRLSKPISRDGLAHQIRIRPAQPA